MLPQFLFSLALTLVSFSSFAQSLDTQIEDQVPHQLQIVGRGIFDGTTKDLLLLGCNGQSLDSTDVDCSSLRLVLKRWGKTPVWYGNSFRVDDIKRMEEELSKTFATQSVDRVFSFLRDGSTYAFTDQNGWNWGSDPLTLETVRFGQVERTVLYYAETQHTKSLEREVKLSENEQAMGTLSCKVRGVYYSEVREKGSTRAIIYSATQTEMIFSLCNHGVLTELKTLQLSKTDGEVKLTGEHYQFVASKALLHATTASYKAVAHFCFSEDSEGMGILFGIVMPAGAGAAAFGEGAIGAGWGAAIGVAAPWVLPVVPVVATVATISVDAIITGISSIVDKDAIAARKFHQLVTEHNVKAGSGVFKSMITQIQAL